jgi:ribosomal protein S18 acetylase RimI-like enzyme
MDKRDIEIVGAQLSDLDWLEKFEEQCFAYDRISRRSMRRFLTSEHCVFLLGRLNGERVGYLLILFHRGTRLARLYSIAVGEAWRGQGVARALMLAGENEARQRGAIYFRLEVTSTNAGAIALYQSLGFREFGMLHDYYDDHGDALRMQKRIRHHGHNAVHTEVPWFHQNTSFTCGPVAIMMAMAGLDPTYKPSLAEELQLWREATTIFMTSGHGGCHPMGLALAATKRGFKAEVWVNQRGPLFVDGVRREAKKTVIETVHRDFVKQAKAAGIAVHYANIDQKTLRKACDQGAVPIVLISTYRLDCKKVPHWVVVSGHDERCFYVHDPDFDEKIQKKLDCQYVPFAQ